MPLSKTLVNVARNLDSTIKLNDGRNMPLFGLGVWQASSGTDGLAEQTVSSALRNGYKMIDTATYYENQRDVGQGLKKSGVKREDIFVVTKLWTNGYQSCRQEFTHSLKQLGCGYVDLYLIHCPTAGRVLESYQAMMEFQDQGLIRSIGVSNFGFGHLEAMKDAGVPTPTVNQIELHPWMKSVDLADYCRQNDIAVMGYSPLANGERLSDPTIVGLGKKLKKSVGQILIRYSVQMGYITIPKTVNQNRLVENAQVFDWSIPEGDMRLLNSFPDTSYPTSWNPTIDPWLG